MSKARKTTTHHIRHETASRLCLRPERIPGVAPPCEDDRIDDGRRRSAMNGHAIYGGHVPSQVTLPRFAFLEGRGDE